MTRVKLSKWLAGSEEGLPSHSELLGKGWACVSFGFELFYELLVFFELVFEHV